MSHALALALSILLTGVAHTVIRKGAQSAANAAQSLFNPYTIAGYVLFGLVTLLMVYAAQIIPLRSLTAWSSLSNVITVMMAVIFLHEKPHPLVYSGVALITLGLIVFFIG